MQTSVEESFLRLLGAKARDISIPDIMLKRIGNSNVLLLKRFDRKLINGEYHRLGYISAMTALGASDGDQRDYIDIIEFVKNHGSRPKDDIIELLKRVRYSLEINNTDDHLRNHDFLREKGGWRLSPVFDINPNPDKNEHRVTAINGATDLEGGLRELIKLESNYI